MKNRPSSFEDAFKLLDEAMLERPAPALGPLVSKEVQFFKSLLVQESQEVGVAVKRLSAMGLENAGGLVQLIEQDIRKNPMVYLGVAALGAAVIGVLASAPKSHPYRRPAPTKLPRTPRPRAKTLKASK